MPRIIGPLPQTGDTGLLWAAIKGHMDVVEFLASKGADIYATNEMLQAQALQLMCSQMICTNASHRWYTCQTVNCLVGPYGSHLAQRSVQERGW